MSDLTQDKRSREHSGDSAIAAEEGSLNAVLPSTSNPKPSSSEHSSVYHSNTAENNLTGHPLQDHGSIADLSTGERLLSSRQGHIMSATAQDDSLISSDTTQDPRRPADYNLEVDETNVQSLLPEDDGMGALRRRIHAIRDLRYTSTEQARMIHDLMTEKYNSSQSLSGYYLSPSSSPTPSSRNLERAHTPNRWSGQSFDQPSLSSASTATSAPQGISHTLTAEDIKPTFYPRVEADLPADDAEDADVEVFEEPSLGCPHYKRNVKLQCYDCKKWYTCRLCHNEVEDHHLNRPKTENMLCMLCGHAQFAAQYCKQCGELAAQYYCAACKLWDNDANRSIYHCNDCGICRVGKGIGKDFFHCKTCSVCLPISIETTHRCIERSTQCDCPICGDYMFTSPETVVFMRCGHSIHQRCLTEYSKSSYRCPICSKTIRNMEATFRNLDRSIQSQPMPVDFKDTKAIITCNDCATKSVVKYHWLGLKCDMCESYNTTQLSVLQGDDIGSSGPNTQGESFSAPRQRSSSYGVDESVLSSLAPLQTDPSSAPGSGAHPQFSPSTSRSQPGQFYSYNLTRGRAISPVISNYFGIPPERQPHRSMSISLFGSRPNQTDENDGDGELSIWGTKFKYKYGFLGRGSDPADDDEEGEELSASSDSEEKASDEEDEEEEAEGIDIFGHR